MTHFLQRTVLILLGGSALTACATTEMRPDYPTRNLPTVATPAPAPTPVAPPADPEPQPTAPPPAAAVEQTPLAPLAPAVPREPAYTPPPRPAEPAYETVTRRSVTGRVVDAAGKAQTYEVKKGDNLGRIADRLGMTVEELKDANDLKGNMIQPGQELKGPASKGKAYVVASGDSLFAIARRFNVSADDLRDQNDLGANATLQVGQRLLLPEGYRDRGPTVTTERVPVAGGEASPPPVSTRPAPRPQAPPVQAEEREPEPAPGPSYRTVSRRTITGRVVEVEGPRASYTVKKGDNLARIAERLDMTVEDLKDANNLKSTTIQPDQVLKGPRTTSKAYVTASGDTLAGIARRFGVTEAALRSENNYRRNAEIRSGMRVKLPDGYRDRGPITVSERVEIPAPRPQPAPQPQPRPYTPPAAAPEPPASLPSAPQPYTPPSRPATPPPVATTPQPTPRPYTPLPPPPTPTPAPTPAPSTPSATPTPRPYVPPAPAPSATPSAADQQISQLGRGRFAWPIRGDIVSDFGAKPGNQRNDGVNIRGSTGDTVRAAAAGDVVYAGDQVPGFGNLVLIKHADGWVTAYGHLARADVKMQQKVAAGQQIGQVGQTGGVSEPQLHFEVRYAPSPLERARPIDPKLVLPR